MSIVSFDFPQLDKKDREILFELDRNARQSNSELAEKLRIDKNTINYRINRLREQGIIKGFYTVIDSAKLGYEAYRVYIKWGSISAKKEKEIKQYLVNSPITWWVGTIDGNYDFVFLVWVKSNAELREFWLKFVGKYQQHIQKKVISVYTKITDMSYAFFAPEKVLKRSIQEAGSGIEVKISETEKKLIMEIADNARAPTVELAKKTKLTAMQVKYAIKQLKEKKIILGFRTKIDLQKLGLTHYKANFNLKDMEQYGEMVEYAKTKANTIYVDESISFADFEVELLAQKHWQFIEFMKEFREKFSDNIIDSNYFILPEINKINYSPVQLE